MNFILMSLSSKTYYSRIKKPLPHHKNHISQKMWKQQFPHNFLHKRLRKTHKKTSKKACREKIVYFAKISPLNGRITRAMSQSQSTEFIENGYKIKISRKRTHVTTYENMQLQTSHPIKDTKKKKIKPSVPSDYAGYNYHNRMCYRRNTIREICNNNFDIPNVVMILEVLGGFQFSNTSE